MTNYWENLDVQHQQLRNSYLFCFQKGDFVGSAHKLYVRNLALPDGARITDMKPFQVSEFGFNYGSKTNAEAFNYCTRWEGLVEMAITEFRSQELEMLNRI